MIRSWDSIIDSEFLSDKGAVPGHERSLARLVVSVEAGWAGI